MLCGKCKSTHCTDEGTQCTVITRCFSRDPFLIFICVCPNHMPIQDLLC